MFMLVVYTRWAPLASCILNNMKTISPIRLIIGLIIILIGVGSLLSSFGLVELGDSLRRFWPLGVIAIGLVVLLSDGRNWLWALILLAAGVGLQLNQLDILPRFNILSLIWPTILIAIGVSILSNRDQRPKTTSKKNRQDISAFLGGADSKAQAVDFQGGKATAVLGGVKLDLRQSQLKGEATLDVFAFCGGVELLVPAHWTIRSKLTPVLGGVEDRTAAPADKHSPVLYLVGDVIMAGVEIKNQ